MSIFPGVSFLCERGFLRAVASAVMLAWSAGAAVAADQDAVTIPPGFDPWLVELRAEARSQGIRDSTLDAALAGVSPIVRVVELDRRQPEFTLTFAQYLDRVVSNARIEEGRAKFAENRALLESIGAKYGVQPRFIVALWGIETGFGRHTGGFPVIASLATLAFEGRRGAFFRKELLIALRILDEGHIEPGGMSGSWAGAMGQNQFMPSSFARFAVDHDGDGRRDIWTTRGDVFASTANYLAGSGWRADLTWGRKVRLPKGFDTALAGARNQRPLSAWQRLGVRRPDGSDLPDRDVAAALVLPEKGARSPAYLVYDNFEAILRWNRSDYFAIAVGYLADAIGNR
jgi:membrane-bound lytic murein transglycosylase B